MAEKVYHGRRFERPEDWPDALGQKANRSATAALILSSSGMTLAMSSALYGTGTSGMVSRRKGASRLVKQVSATVPKI